MSPVGEGRTARLCLGDCLDALRAMPPASVDAVVCDPPYELGFMGKSWDSSGVAFDPATWREALRVLKPGGYLLAFGGTRTYHRIAVAIEDAGFEIRDSLTWNYGCFDDETEVLTPSGWVRYDSITVGCRVLGYVLETATVEWMDVEDRPLYDYADTAFRLVGVGTDQLLSRGHRCVVERDGIFVVASIEDVARQREARVPILESMSGLFDGLPVCHAGAGRAEHRVLEAVSGICSSEQSNGCSQAAVGKEGAVRRVCGVSEAGVALRRASASAESEGAFLLSEVQRCSSGRGVGEARAQGGTAGEPGGAGEAAFADDGRSESGVEGGRDVFLQEGELHGGQVRAMSPGLYADVSAGWVCHGTPAAGGDSDGQVPFPAGGCASHGPQSSEQHTEQSGVVCDEQRPQAVRIDRITRTVMARVEPVPYVGVMWCVTVRSGAVIARRRGHVFITGNSGFPKSLNVSIAIDKAAGAMGHRGKAITVAGYTPGRDLAIGKGVPAHEPITDEARAWKGWGTALKPAFEPVVVARRPLEGTVAANVLAHGTGAMNIDGCRVGYESTPNPATNPLFRKEAGYKNTNASDAGSTSYSFKDGSGERNPNVGGRWPANVILTHAPGCRQTGTRTVAGDERAGDAVGGKRPGGFGNVGAEKGEGKPNGRVYGTETVATYDCEPGCPVAALDAQSGRLQSGDGKSGNKVYENECGQFVGVHGNKSKLIPHMVYNDTGGASRFFTVTEYGDDDLLPGELPGDPPFLYASKAARSEREAGCDGLPARTGAEAVDREEGSAGTQSPRAGAGRTADKVRNHHPTVKPLSVMRWLCRLVTPPGGIVLDPFMGSGTTGVAALLEGFDFIGCEREVDYLLIADARIAHHAPGARLLGPGDP